MRERQSNPDLAAIVAEELSPLLDSVEIGAPLPVDSASSICSALEYLIPEVLARSHAEWESESLDGFYFSHATRNGPRSAELAGTCILISDQTVTPFSLDLELSADGAISHVRIRLGEPGTGRLGISGPECGSSAAWKLTYLLDERLEQVEWVYNEAS